MSHPTKLLSVRGILLAKTHFDVLGFEGARLRPEDMTDAGVLAAYRLAAARCHPSEGCDALGAQTAFCRVGRAFAALRTAVGRHHAWREMCAGRGALASTMSPDPTVVTHPWTSEHALEHSPGVLAPDPEHLVEALERWRTRGDDVHRVDSEPPPPSRAREGAPRDAEGARVPTDPAVAATAAAAARTPPPSSLEPLRRETTFLVRERGAPGAAPAACAMWLGGEPGAFELRYRWATSRRPDGEPDGAWRVGAGGEVLRATRARPSPGGGGPGAKRRRGAGVFLTAAGNPSGGLLLTAPSVEEADEWLAALRAAMRAELREGRGKPRGKGGVRGAVPSPVRRQLEATQMTRFVVRAWRACVPSIIVRVGK